MADPELWARTRVRTSRHVRRGGWYRVRRVTPLECVLEVNQRPVTVPRAWLQVLPVQPTRWSVVARLRDARYPPASWGSFYGVCPNCSARAPLGRHWLSAPCPRCQGVFLVAWEEPAWCVFEAGRVGRDAEAAL